MVVRIAIEGRIRDKNTEAFVAEYKKRLTPFFDFQITELGSGNSKALDKLVKNAKPDDFFIGFDAQRRPICSICAARMNI